MKNTIALLLLLISTTANAFLSSGSPYILSSLTGAGTDNCIARWNGTGAYVLQDSVVCISDLGAITGITTIAASSLTTAGGVVYSDGTNIQDTVAGTSGQALISGGAGAPTWYAPTATRVLFAGTGGILADDAGLTYASATDVLTVAGNLIVDDGLLYVGNRTGGMNTFLGTSSGNAVTASSERNVGVGYQSLLLTTDGTNNVGIGYQALIGNTLGQGNVGLGSGANRSNQTGVNNMAIGLEALFNNTGSYNVGIGQGSLYNQASADNNVAIGRQSLVSNVTGANNVAIGYEAGFSSLGSRNLFLGYQAGYSETGSDKLYIDTSNTTAPLIHGDFSSNHLTINGTLAVTGLTPAGSVLFMDASSVVTSDGNGLFYDNTNNRLGVGVAPTENTVTIGGASLGSTLTVHAEGATDIAEYSLHRHSNTAGFGSHFVGVRSRGTESAETVVQSSDSLVRYIATGHDGTDYEQAAAIEAVVDGTPGAGDMPGACLFKTSPDGAASPVTRMTIENDGDIGIDGGGLFYANSGNVLSIAAGQFNLDNLRLDGNTISSTNTNGNIQLDPDGTGVVDVVGSIQSSALTSGRVTFAGASGVLTDDADFQWDSSTNQLGLSATGQVRFYDTAGGEYVGLRATGTTTSSVVYYFPPADGTAGQFLRTDGSGGLSWATGGGNLAVSATNANYTFTSTDQVITADASGGSYTLTLPAAAGLTGKVYYIKRTDGTFANTVTVDANLSETIDGALTKSLVIQYSDLVIMSNGSNWLILEESADFTYARFTTAAGQTVTNGNIIDFGTADIQFPVNAVTTGASWKFTAPETGVYEIDVNVRTQTVAASIGNIFGIQFYIDGSSTNIGFYDVCENTTSRPYGASGHKTAYLQAGQYLDVRFSETLPSVSLETNGNLNYISIRKAGDYR